VEDPDAFATGGEYELQDGFGWTNGVLLSFMNKYHINTRVPDIDTESTDIKPDKKA
jgi:hypothetical protein